MPAAILGLALAAAFGTLRFLNADPPEREAEWLGDLALAASFATPGLLALLGLRERPSLLLAGGALGVFLSGVSLSFVSLPLLVPSVLYLVAYRRAPGRGIGAASTAAVLLLALGLGAAGLFALFLREDPLCWAVTRTAEGRSYTTLPANRFRTDSGFSVSSSQLPAGTIESGCTSDTISTVEALAGLALVGAALVGGSRLARPRSPSSVPAPGR
ncbi:MAG: hypothetical protein HYU54_04210 [Actinobacteria bacterium]|nr:hypothetical protein [Actinomycetota bacterium]